VVSPQKQVFKCFGCGKGGNIISFLMEIEKMDYLDAIKALATESHIDIEPLMSKKQQYSESTSS
jgi:DNA primase